jgi:hypothetical protein
MPARQGIDLKAGGRNKKTARTAPKSDNVYLKLLVKVGVCARGRAGCFALVAQGPSGLRRAPALTSPLRSHAAACSCTAFW